MLRLIRQIAPLQSKSKFIKIGLIAGYFQILKFCGRLKFLEAAIEQAARFIFYALWQAPCARIAIGKDIASPLSASGAGTERYLPMEGRNFTASFEVKF